MERSVYFLINNGERLVRNDNGQDNASDMKSSEDSNTSMISDTFSVNKVIYDVNGNKTEESVSETFVGVRSLFNTSQYMDVKDEFKKTSAKLKSYNYINYRGQGSNPDPLSKVTNTTTVAAQVETSYTSIIEYTAKHPALILRPSDFVYHKDFGVFPPNRLLVVRRFNTATTHDLLRMSARPISTLVTWLKPEDEPFIIKFNEKWKISDEGFINVINDVLGFSDLKPLPTFENLSTFTQTLAIQIGHSLGINYGRNNPLGDPDVIHEAAIRETNYKGLELDMSVTYKGEFEMKYIDGVDPNMAMLDIIANCTRMGTSDSKFIVSGGFASKVDDILILLQNGDVDGTIESLISRIGGFIQNTSSKFLSNMKETLNKELEKKEEQFKQEVQDKNEEGANDTKQAENAAQEKFDKAAEKQKGEKQIESNISELKDYVGNFIKTSLSKYKWRLRGASAAMSGFHTAHWHVTMGNPLCPWFSCGNMYIDTMQLEFPHTEMSFSDIPMSIKVTATFKPGRVMGAQEIQQLFNSGKDRIYTVAPTTQVGFIAKPTGNNAVKPVKK